MEKLVGKLFIICGVPGSGKTTVQEYLTKNLGFTKVVTHTTRKIRNGEMDGKDYYFETKESFFENHYLEHVNYDSNYYGSSIEGLKKALSKTNKAVIVLDTKGVMTYLEKLPKELVTVIYLAPPTLAEQKRRLLARGDDKELVAKRLGSDEAKRDQTLPKELVKEAYILENNDLKQTYQKLDELVKDICYHN